MELVWLEDFNALAEHGSFVRAAEARHITQPAFSRRIRSLEQWMGVKLFVRTPQGTTLTEAGSHIQVHAFEAIGRLYRLRAEAQEVAGKAAKTLQFAATHSLSFSFFPRWIRRIENGAPIEAIQLHSDSMLGCEQLLVQGEVPFLLCHLHPEVPSPLIQDQFVSQKVGDDTLIALVASSLLGTHAPNQLPYLAYTEASGLGRIVAHRLYGSRDVLALKAQFSSHLAAVLMSMALEGKGVAWLPKSLAEQEIRDGRLVRVLDPCWDIDMQIHLVRPRTSLSPAAENFWTRVADLSADV
ncbi:LysR family transcriptional regulator [Vreelandella neptunia]|uniref:LysR substrate-binding domain-containing protein n=1 Tax=Vreelandella neptunia TaxID=115551 RepID=A0ABS9S457_9GAMM|nr:LysR substrate-binding domain-containing protein [Halomonas neptunia]MCH4810878.1 LysR substrate-binding domain-containing protein [Halomonas neptunia]